MYTVIIEYGGLTHVEYVGRAEQASMVAVFLRR